MKTAILLFCIVILGMQHQALARPQIYSRMKRSVSEPYYTEMQSRVALKKVDGVAVTLPIGYGRNLEKIGRKRRSQSTLMEKLFNSNDDELSEKMRWRFHHILIAQLLPPPDLNN